MAMVLLAGRRKCQFRRMGRVLAILRFHKPTVLQTRDMITELRHIRNASLNIEGRNGFNPDPAPLIWGLETEN